MIFSLHLLKPELQAVLEKGLFLSKLVIPDQPLPELQFVDKVVLIFLDQRNHLEKHQKAISRVHMPKKQRQLKLRVRRFYLGNASIRKVE